MPRALPSTASHPQARGQPKRRTIMKSLVIAAICAAPILPSITDTPSEAHSEGSSASHSDPFGFPSASRGMEILSWADATAGRQGAVPEPGQQGPSFTEMLTDYGRATGQTVVYNSHTKSLLDGRMIDVSDTMQIPAERVQQTVESLLAMHQFVMVPLTTTAPRMVQVISLETMERETVRSSAISVSAEHLDLAAQHPAVICRTVVELPHTDVRQLSNSLRGMITDTNTTQIIPGGIGRSIILFGRGKEVASTAQMMLEIDASTARSNQAALEASAE